MSKKNGDFDFIPLTSADKSDTHKSNIIETALINVGSLVVYAASYSARKIAYVAALCAAKIKPDFSAAHRSLMGSVKKKIKGAGQKVVKTVESISAFNKSFSDSVKNVGFGETVKTRFSEFASNLKKNKSVFSTLVNHAVPVAAIALLVGIVYNTAVTSYGISVEYNGQELGVVTAESVISDAQEAIADRAVYYETNDEIFVTAKLSIKPLDALDEVIDEVALADKMEEQIAVNAEIAPAEAAAVEEIPLMPLDGDVPADMNAPATESVVDSKIRAYAVTVDGEMIGAVENTESIANFLENEKAKYMDGNVVSVDFDKNVEYDYEQYVFPEEIVSQQVIINKLQAIVSEPVYYEVQQGDSPWNIAQDNEMSLDELKNCFASFNGSQISDITSECPVGAIIQLSAEVPFLQVMVTKNVTYTGTIDYEIVKTEDPNMYKGDSAVDVAGVEGEAEYTALITYKNDVPVSREIISETVITEPVTKEMRVGTRETTTEVSTGSGGSGDYFWPVGGGYISAYFGDGRGHKGIDIAAPYGTPIYAAEAGTITRATNKYDGYGNCVFISQNDGNVTVYAHMSSIAISYGDYVVKGQLIGYVGSTGDSTGNHCHFEVRTNGYYNNPCDYVSQY